MPLSPSTPGYTLSVRHLVSGVSIAGGDAGALPCCPKSVTFAAEQFDSCSIGNLAGAV
jgi:hypothetical protein